MKSLRIRPLDSRNKEIKSKCYLRKGVSTFDYTPTPLDFDAFIPWFCLQLHVSKNVIITRSNQAEYPHTETKKSGSVKSKSKNNKIKLSEIKRDDTKTNVSLVTKTIGIRDTIPVTTYYDRRGRLVEIAIIGCPIPIHRKVIQAFNLCLPFHSGLSKLTIRKCELGHIIIHEVGKLLPHSNITEICFDDSYVPEGDYSILLEYASRIKYLSLKRCGIHDGVCKNIAVKLELQGPATKTLLALDLSSNKITDLGAKALGDILKTNRYLLHLNLSGNNISDEGAIYMLKHLMDFQLGKQDVIEMKRRRFVYFKSKLITYKKCLEEAKLARLESSKRTSILSEQLSPRTNVKNARPKKLKKIAPSFVVTEPTVEDVAEMKTKEILGDFDDPFADENIRREDGTIYSTGNLTICSINLAFNNITLLSVKQILKVLKYQSGINNTSRYTGLLRVVIDGNNIPTSCSELDDIQMFLQKALIGNERNKSIISFTKSSPGSGRKI